MDGHTDPGFVRGQFRQRAGIDAIDFKEISGGLHTSTFIAVKVGLAFGDMEGIRGCAMADSSASSLRSPCKPPKASI